MKTILLSCVTWVTLGAGIAGAAVPQAPLPPQAPPLAEECHQEDGPDRDGWVKIGPNLWSRPGRVTVYQPVEPYIPRAAAAYHAAYPHHQPVYMPPGRGAVRCGPGG